MAGPRAPCRHQLPPPRVVSAGSGLRAPMVPSLLMSHRGTGVRPDELVLRAAGGWGLPALSLLSTPGRSPAGARQEPGRSRRTMAAASFVQEMRSMGEKLLLKLQRLPQAEPVEIVAFSVILLFTATVLLLLLSACCCCHAERRRGKVHARPVTPP
ncbi:small integral membrane protein 5 isoform X1 [Neomonachus schauinslandi]|uniref:Small integral membrane protein 5 isoform X1 n=3 Tax=Monachinae TaxID=3410119 RepID=A0A2Y9GC97_NEOSC|nr:small integral membrane protein 5 isoform X1 [Neomonachus schauinslandi]